jgi:hypothetical protein
LRATESPVTTRADGPSRVEGLADGEDGLAGGAAAVGGQVIPEPGDEPLRPGRLRYHELGLRGFGRGAWSRPPKMAAPL